MSALHYDVNRSAQPDAGCCGADHAWLRVGSLALSDATGRVSAAGAPVLLRPLEFRLLHVLMRQPERVHSRAELLAHAWGRSVYVGERTIDVHIRRLRMSLQPFGMNCWIVTVHSRGYCFSPQLN